MKRRLAEKQCVGDGFVAGTSECRYVRQRVGGDGNLARKVSGDAIDYTLEIAQDLTN